MERTLVLFDIGGVLLKLNYERFYTEAAQLALPDSNTTLAEEKRRIKEQYEQSGLETQTLLGTIDSRQYLRGLSRIITKKTISDQKLLNTIQQAWDGPIKEMVALKRLLQQNDYAVGLLSNMGRLAFPLLQAKHPELFALSSVDSPAIYSCEHGVIKPHPDIYKLVPEEYTQVIFIDDKASYIIPALDIFTHWKGIHYTGHLDTLEPIRAVAGHNSEGEHDRMFVASNVEEVEHTLHLFGVHIKHR